MTNVVRFPIGEDRPYNVKTELFKTLDASSLPPILVDIFKRSALQNRNVISTTQWNINSFMIADENPELGGISIMTDFRSIEAPLFALRRDLDYVTLKYFPNPKEDPLIPTNGAALSVLFNSYMKYLPDIGAENWKFVVNLLDTIDSDDTIVVEGFKLDNDCFVVKFVDPNNKDQGYALFVRPLPLLLDHLANFPQFKKEQPRD